MAVALSFDVDGETAYLFDKKNKSRLSLLSMGAYGRGVGLDRILGLLKKFDLKADFFIPGALLEIDPTVVERIMEGDHYIGHHGYRHERLDSLNVDEEEEILIKGRDLIKKYTGSYPNGYRAPSWEINPGTPQLLKKYGFQFDSSLMGCDSPYTIDAGNDGRLLEIPVTWLLDDWEQFAYSAEPRMGYSIEEPDKVYRLWKSEFDALYEERGCFVLTMHPQIIGRASRMKMLENLVSYMMSRNDIWFTTLNEITEKYLEGKINVEHQPVVRIDKFFD